MESSHTHGVLPDAIRGESPVFPQSEGKPDTYTTQLIFNIVCPAGEGGSDEQTAVIPLALLSRFDGIALLALLSVWFSLEVNPNIHFRGGGAHFRIGRPHSDSVVASEDAFISVVPHITQWLEVWTRSPLREPELQPKWVEALGLTDSSLKRLAKLFRNVLAERHRRVIPIALRDGVWIELLVPPRDCLKAPSAPSEPQQESFIMSHIQRMAAFWDAAGGQLILIPEEVATELMRQEGGILRVDSRDITRRKMRAPRSLIVPKRKKGKSHE